MSKTKTMPPGYPVVDDNGAITGLTIDEIAKRVGKQLGVQDATYQVAGPGWVRIARVHSNACLFLLSSVYVNTPPRGVLISVSGAYSYGSSDAKILSGNVSLFDKVRFVGGSGGEIYFEIHSSIAADRKNIWIIKSISTSSIYETSADLLYQSFTAGSIPEGFAVKEFSLEQLRGGVKLSLSSDCKIALNGLIEEGGPHERKNEDGQFSAVERYSRLVDRSCIGRNDGKNETIHCCISAGKRFEQCHLPWFVSLYSRSSSPTTSVRRRHCHAGRNSFDNGGNFSNPKLKYDCRSVLARIDKKLDNVAELKWRRNSRSEHVVAGKEVAV